jgi:hypothetical protein
MASGLPIAKHCLDVLNVWRRTANPKKLTPCLCQANVPAFNYTPLFDAGIYKNFGAVVMGYKRLSEQFEYEFRLSFKFYQTYIFKVQ